MTKRELIENLKALDDEDDIRVVLRGEHTDELEDGSVLTIEDTGFIPRVGHVLYVESV